MKNEIWSWIGDLSQVAELNTMSYVVAEQRVQKRLMSYWCGTGIYGGKRSRAGYCMASYKDTALSFITPNGVVAPAFLSLRATGFYVAFTRGY